jgi:hypothetical protein
MATRQIALRPSGRRLSRIARFSLRYGISRMKGKVDPESLYEENARRAGLGIMYMAPSELGVEKVVKPGRGRGR